MTAQTKKTELEIIEETAECYNSSNRASYPNALSITGETCMYYYDGKTCAVGRCLENPHQFQEFIGDSNDFDNEFGLENQLKPEYCGKSLKFWTRVQSFHDHHENWDAEGLTHEGHIKYNELIEQYS